jgi:flavin reductase (DIM6/NTAB) family NADH-FMN oxidoreductase RutF
MTQSDSSRMNATAALGAAEEAFDGRDFRNALGSFGTGVTIITAATADGRKAGLTCNSFASVSLNPPLVLWSLVVHSPSLGLFQEASHFAVNVLSASQADLALRFARPSNDKYSGLSWRPGLGLAPVLADTVASFECRNAYRYYGGDHVIFLGHVESYTYNQKEPLLFSRGKFGSFAAAETP